MAKLILFADEKRIREIPLSKERVTIGRRPHNDIVIEHPAISGEHAVIVTHLEDSFLEDLNSTNGTQVNGQPIKRHYLQDNDLIELAQYRIQYLSGSEGEATAQNQDLGRVLVLNGVKAGHETILVKAITTIGMAGQQVAAILRMDGGYSIATVDESALVVINGQPVGTQPQPLLDGDIIELQGTRLRFLAPGA
ncbi:FHA domain-containing protein [Noviherbaspirillum sp.]|uniref:FHA domain-containing protein n=1 Tax=Noviherbaspirillum sp. TaxID=1926288 RepID=UPI002D24F317|nr:FHA domain-containing protein [Noviherbaspirillum sp.]HZW21319.1 FHA domain-containing protein [Noviherbaspirillum sp.]